MLASALLAGYLIFSYLGGVALHRFPRNSISLLALLILTSTFAIYSIFSHYIVLLGTSFLMGGGAATVYMGVFPTISEHCNKERYGRTMGGVLSGAGIGILVVSGIASFYQHSELLVPYVWGITFCLSILISFATIINNRYSTSPGIPVNTPPKLSFYHTIWLQLFRSKILLRVLLAYFFYGFSYASFINYIFAYISEMDNGLHSSGTFLWVAFGISSIFSSIFWGNMFDRFNKKNVITINYSITFLAIFITLIFPSKTFLIIGSILFGLCFFGYITLIGGYIIFLTGSLSSVCMGKLTLIHTIGQINRSISRRYSS